jgi:maltooligosyltrehalose trehalohydrolase
MTARGFRVWAPRAGIVELVLRDERQPMAPEPNGWFSTSAPASHGDRYGFSLDDGPVRPDPRAVWLPDGVHRPGAVYDHDRFGWGDRGWTGRDWPDAVLYEMHVGTFTAPGTFDAATARLDHLVDLGVTHVELLPVCAFDGTHGWGYDGVAPWSVHEPYGGPDGLKRFVDAAHSRRLSVLLDVVHNHLGPSGAYLAEFGPFFTDRYHTPWGQAINLDGPGSDEVRTYLLGSVEAWVRDFHVDGIRLDAVHEMQDNRALPFLEELSAEVARLADDLGRPLVTIAESDRNDPWTVMPSSAGGLGLTAQWDDDVHHALHTWLTGEKQGYYADFAAEPARALRAVFTSAFFHAGGYSTFRGRCHGRPVDTSVVSGSRFVASLQTHDQVGNRAVGDRLCDGLSPGRLAAGAALLLLGPFVPMLFMGEEWAAGTPWLFFSSFPDPELAQAVTRGRRAEFAEHGWPTDEIPDPQDPQTRNLSVLDWDEPEHEPHATMLSWYRTLIQLRRDIPALRDPDLTGVRIDVDGPLVVLHRGRHLVAANSASAPVRVPLGGAVVEVLAAFGAPDLPPSPDRLMLPAEAVTVVRVQPADR